MDHGKIGSKNLHILSDQNNDCSLYFINQTIGNNQNANPKPRLVWSPQTYNQEIRFPWYKSGFVVVESKDWIFKNLEHFMCYSPGTAVNGVLGLKIHNTGTASAATILSSTRLGVLNLATGTTATGAASVFSPGTGVRFDSGQLVLEFLASIPTLPSSTEAFEAILGFGDSASSTNPIDGAYFYASQASSNWQLRARSNNSLTKNIDSGVAVQSGYIKLAVNIEQSPLRASFFIEDNFVGEIGESFLPYGSGRETGIQASVGKSAGTTSRSLYLDSIMFGAYV